MNNLLTSRAYNTADHPELPHSWYAPQDFLRTFKSVSDVVLTDTTSSAGDWQGYILQTIGEWHYVIVFSQVNNYPRRGFTVYTAEHPAISFLGDMTPEEIARILYQEA